MNASAPPDRRKRKPAVGFGYSPTVEGGLMNTFGVFARHVNRFVASPAATAGAFAIIIAWALCGPVFHYSDGWQLVINTGTTIITFLMVFVLNNAQARDTTAMNAKLDATSS